MTNLEQVATTGAAIGAGVGARKITQTLWTKVTGSEPPKDPTDASTSWGDAIAWTVMVGVVVGLLRLFARRGAKALVA